MKRTILVGLGSLLLALVCFSFKDNSNPASYATGYRLRLAEFSAAQESLMVKIAVADMEDSISVEGLKEDIANARLRMKGIDFWTRYLDPTAYKGLNGPLPVEWETEVFEKFEKPYRREGAGLTLAELYLDEPHPQKDSLLRLIAVSQKALAHYTADTVMRELQTFHHFLLCNRLHLLNLAAIYTTGFECPNPGAVIPELRSMMTDTRGIYNLYNESFSDRPVTTEYLRLYDSAILFTKRQPDDAGAFDHFTFLKDYVNPLFALNAAMIGEYGVVSHSLIDFSLNKSATSIFSKGLYRGQNAKGIFTRVRDSATLAQIDRLGKLLFYDPILSGNNMRSCASCHKPGQAFTDTSGATALAYNHTDFLPRNTPSLLNADYNHLVMLDGAHISLQAQTRGVITAASEMGGTEAAIVKKVMSCDEYRIAFTKLLELTPQEPQVSFEHISSALTAYYAKFSQEAAPFDAAMNRQAQLSPDAREGFNVFMNKAQCATCHFVPQFNGVKPPYVGSEFEVLGVPADTGYKKLSADLGRYGVNPATQTLHAFRTGTIRNAARTAPYMHNGVFRTLRQVIDFYDGGGGAGHGLLVENQTLNAEKLQLTEGDKTALIAFMESLNERVQTALPPVKLPRSHISALNSRKPGGVY